MVMINKGTLMVLAEAISKIEDKDDDYMNNEVWQKLRMLEDEAYKIYAEQEMAKSQERKDGCNYDDIKEKASKVISQCKEYLGVIYERRR